jgi:hypothetical protein
MAENPIIYVTRDIERALGAEPSPSYCIVANDSPYARSMQEKYPDFVILVESPHPLDTFEILEKEETAVFLEKVFGKEKPAIVVFKNTVRIEELCTKKSWELLNPSSSLAEKIENKISQAEWLGELAELLPSFIIAPAKEIVWQKKPLVLQWAHAHTGEGTIVINDNATLAALQKKFPDRPAKASEFIKGPTFTVNVAVGSVPTGTSFLRAIPGFPKPSSRPEGSPGSPPKGVPARTQQIQIAIGNPSYQITGMPPLTDSPFATVGNDWSLPYTLLNERHLDELRGIAEKVGAKMSDSGWKGLFGVDVIYDEERDQFKLIEINARQPASTTYESQLQARFRGHGLIGATIFEAHLAALTGSTRSDLVQIKVGPWQEKQIELNDGAQLVQRVTSQGRTSYKSRSDLVQIKVGPWTEKIAALNKAGYTTIPYSNTKPNSDFLRIQSDKGLLASHGKWNARGEKIIEILEK